MKSSKIFVSKKKPLGVLLCGSSLLNATGINGGQDLKSDYSEQYSNFGLVEDQPLTFGKQHPASKPAVTKPKSVVPQTVRQPVMKKQPTAKSFDINSPIIVGAVVTTIALVAWWAMQEETSGTVTLSDRKAYDNDAIISSVDSDLKRLDDKLETKDEEIEFTFSTKKPSGFTLENPAKGSWEGKDKKFWIPVTSDMTGLQSAEVLCGLRSKLPKDAKVHAIVDIPDASEAALTLYALCRVVEDDQKDGKITVSRVSMEEGLGKKVTEISKGWVTDKTSLESLTSDTKPSTNTSDTKPSTSSNTSDSS